MATCIATFIATFSQIFRIFFAFLQLLDYQSVQIQDLLFDCDTSNMALRIPRGQYSQELVGTKGEIESMLKVILIIIFFRIYM